jgi:hypothetical protein
MCAASNTRTAVTSTSTTALTKPVPKWLKMKQQNKSSAGKTAKPIVKPSSNAQKPQQDTRNAKRARWAKKAKPVAKPIVKKGPVKEYVSKCCSLPATKPAAGLMESVKDAESGKMKEQAKGLGHWRCSGCHKVCKVRSGAAIIESKGDENKCHQTPQLTDVPLVEKLQQN